MSFISLFASSPRSLIEALKVIGADDVATMSGLLGPGEDHRVTFGVLCSQFNARPTDLPHFVALLDAARMERDRVANRAAAESFASRVAWLTAKRRREAASSGPEMETRNTNALSGVVETLRMNQGRTKERHARRKVTIQHMKRHGAVTPPASLPNSAALREEATRKRWVAELTAMVEETDTPAVRLHSSSGGTPLLVGAGRRASTLRGRVLKLRRFTKWLKARYDLAFPTDVLHITSFLEDLHHQGVTQGQLRANMRAIAFFEFVAGVEIQNQLTKKSVLKGFMEELVVRAQPTCEDRLLGRSSSCSVHWKSSWSTSARSPSTEHTRGGSCSRRGVC